MSDFNSIIKKHVGEDGNIPASAIETVVSAIKTAVGDEYVSKDRYKAKLGEIDSLKEKLQTTEDSVTTAEKWKSKFDDLKKEYEQYKQDEATKETKRTKENAYKQLLKECNVSDKRISSVLRVSDLEGIELDEDGKIVNADELKKSIKKEWSDFIYSESEKGAETATPPTNTGGKKSKEEIMAIKDSVERQNAIAENLDLFQ